MGGGERKGSLNSPSKEGIRGLEKEGKIVAKAIDGQRYPLPLCEYMLCDGERGSGPEGADDLCSVIFEDLSLNVSIKPSMYLGLDRCWDLSLKIEI